MKISSLLFPIFFLLNISILAQAPDTAWTKVFGGTDADVGASAIETSDGHYVVTGVTASFGAVLSDVGLLKTYSNGDLFWLYTFGGAGFDAGYSVIETSDGGYVVVGYSNSYGAGNYDAWLMKTDSTGSLQWAQSYGGNDNDFGLSVKQTPDGGYIIAGYTASFGAGLNDVWLVKVDPNGNPSWQKTYGAAGDDFGQAVELTSDGGYVVVGFQNSFSAGNYDIGFLKADLNGNLVWLKNFGGANDDRGHSVKATTDGGYIITGQTKSSGAGGSDVWLIKTDASGNELWTKTYGGVEDDAGQSVDETSDGSFVVTGRTKSFGAANEDIGFLKTDPAGNLIWITLYGGPQNDFGYSVKQTTDGGYIITGGTYSYGAGSSDVWLIKVESDVSEVEDEVIVNHYNLYQNYPNPFNPMTNIKYEISELSFVSLKVFDVLGNEVAILVNEEQTAGSYKVEFDATGLPSGIYFYKMQIGSIVETKKMVLLQ